MRLHFARRDGSGQQTTAKQPPTPFSPGRGEAAESILKTFPVSGTKHPAEDDDARGDQSDKPDDEGYSKPEVLFTREARPHPVEQETVTDEPDGSRDSCHTEGRNRMTMKAQPRRDEGHREADEQEGPEKAHGSRRVCSFPGLFTPVTRCRHPRCAS